MNKSPDKPPFDLGRFSWVVAEPPAKKIRERSDTEGSVNSIGPQQGGLQRQWCFFFLSLFLLWEFSECFFL